MLLKSVFASWKRPSPIQHGARTPPPELGSVGRELRLEIVDDEVVGSRERQVLQIDDGTDASSGCTRL